MELDPCYLCALLKYNLSVHVLFLCVCCMHACMCEVVDRITCFNLNAVHLLEGTQLNVLIPSYASEFSHHPTKVHIYL
jgi:hypothetical protein